MTNTTTLPSPTLTFDTTKPKQERYECQWPEYDCPWICCSEEDKK